MTRNLPRCGLAAAATGALALGLAGGPAASAGSDAGTAKAPATIAMKFDGKKRVFFDGPEEVVAGQPLKIVNMTKPRKIGPHTFSLTERDLRPDTKQERKGCFAPGKICLQIALAHEFDPKTEKINKDVVKTGKAGWDKQFTKKAAGDSWYTEKLGGTFSQKVSAEAGSTLFYLCAVHPGMKGKIEVVE